MSDSQKMNEFTCLFVPTSLITNLQNTTESRKRFAFTLITPSNENWSRLDTHVSENAVLKH